MGRCNVLCVLVRCFVVVNLSVFTGFANGLRVPECIGGNIDIREDNNPVNSITCEGFTATQGIRWTLNSDGAEQASITCGTAIQTCSHTYPGITVTRPNITHSVLVLETLHRVRLGNGGYISCGADGLPLGTSPFPASCNARVIASAENSTQPSSPGQASSTGPTAPQPTSTSTPSTTPSQVPYPSPTTTSSPGPSVTQPPSSPPHPGSSDQSSSPPHPGSSDQSSSPPHPGSSDRPSTSGSPKSVTAGGSGGDGDVPLGAIIGGVIAAVVVIILIVVIVLVVRKRRQRSSHMMSGHAKYDTEDDEVEEHVNPMYGTGPDDAEDGSPEKTAKPAAVAFRIPSSSATNNNTTITTPTATNAATTLTTNANTRHEDPSGNKDDDDDAVETGYSSVSFRRSQTSPPASTSDPVLSTSATPSQLESAYAGLYAAADEDDFASPQVVPENADSYAMVSDPTNQVPSRTVQPVSAEGDVGESDYAVGDVDSNTADTPTPGDVYAVVDKSGLRPASVINTTSSDTGEGESSDVYAVVDKPSVKKSAPFDVTLGDDVTETSAEPTGDVYAQVVKSANRDSASAPTDSMLVEAEDALYAQVQKGKLG